MNLRAVLTDRRLHRLALLGSVLGIGMLLLAWKMGYRLEDLKAAWLWTEEFLSTRPWLMFLAIVILPGFPVPISPVMVLVGALFHEHPIIACLGCLAALMANQAWTYWVAARPGRSLVEWMLKRGNVQVPEVAAHHHMKWLLIVRLTPAFPLFIQNYMLGFIRIPYLRYAWVSILCSGLITCGMVLTGAGIGEGRLGPILTGAGVLVVMIVLVKVIGNRLVKDTAKQV